MDSLDEKVMTAAREEGLLAERQPDSGIIKQLEDFIDMSRTPVTLVMG